MLQTYTFCITDMPEYASQDEKKEEIVQNRRHTRTRISSSNIVGEHQAYMARLSRQLRESNLSQKFLPDQREECREAKTAREIAGKVCIEVNESKKYFQERKVFWKLFK